jgi:hypothetical protein
MCAGTDILKRPHITCKGTLGLIPESGETVGTAGFHSSMPAVFILFRVSCIPAVFILFRVLYHAFPAGKLRSGDASVCSTASCAAWHICHRGMI